MGFHSKRFQFARTTSSQTFREKPFQPTYFGREEQQLPQQNQKKARLSHDLKSILSFFYACLCTCWTILSEFTHFIICQLRKQTEPQVPTSPVSRVGSSSNGIWKSVVSQESTEGLHPNIQTPIPAIPSVHGPNYSSDDDSDIYSDIGTPDGIVTDEAILNNAIDDHELPLVRLIDNVQYLFNLQIVNFPAFLQEVCSNFVKWMFSEGGSEGLTYGHNLDPRRNRSELLKKGLAFFKRRELKGRMTRVEGSSHRRWVLKIALVSRLVIVLAQMVCRNLPPLFKHENDGFKFVPEETYGKWLDPLVNRTLGGFVNWDANFFLHISVYGYTSENIMAFFPLLPMTLFIPSRIAYLLLGSIISLSSIVIVSAVLLNIWLFLRCTENIYELASLWSGGSQQFITTACLMFSFNPASIFFSGLYTETLFAYLTSTVILSLFDREYWTALICSAMSGLCRSNGILNVGFILALQLQCELLKKHPVYGIRWMKFLAQCALIGAFAAIPFLLYQIFGMFTFCDGSVVHDPKSIPPYCLGFSLYNLPYSYIQKKYWNVGFLQYYEFKQIPNFILAIPALYVLGSKSARALIICLSQMKTNRNVIGLYYSSQAIHGLFLTFFCLLFVHVQVSTRMIMAACPYIYAFVADAHIMELEMFRLQKIALPQSSLLITLWCLVYYSIGTVGFCLGLPWT